MKTNKMGPIIRFDTVDEMAQCAAEWCEILYLTDWVIQCRLRNKHDMPREDGDTEAPMGFVWRSWPSKAATISLLMHEDGMIEGELIKPCHEHVLLHELIHLTRLAIVNSTPDVPDLYFDIQEHQYVEFMARSLLRARYNLSRDFFTNYPIQEGNANE